MKQLQNQLEQQSAASLAAYDQPFNPPRSFQSGNLQGPPTQQLEQLQRQVIRLEHDLQRYQNLYSPDSRFYQDNQFRSIQGRDLSCSFCFLRGHSWQTCRECLRQPRFSSPHGMPPQLAIENSHSFRSRFGPHQGNA